MELDEAAAAGATTIQWLQQWNVSLLSSLNSSLNSSVVVVTSPNLVIMRWTQSWAMIIGGGCGGGSEEEGSQDHISACWWLAEQLTAQSINHNQPWIMTVISIMNTVIWKVRRHRHRLRRRQWRRGQSRPPNGRGTWRTVYASTRATWRTRTWTDRSTTQRSGPPTRRRRSWWRGPRRQRPVGFGPAAAAAVISTIGGQPGQTPHRDTYR